MLTIAWLLSLAFAALGGFATCMATSVAAERRLRADQRYLHLLQIAALQRIFDSLAAEAKRILAEKTEVEAQLRRMMAFRTYTEHLEAKGRTDGQAD